MSDVDATVANLAKSCSVLKDFSFYMTVPLAGSPKHLAVNCDGSILSVCVTENGINIVRLYDIQSFFNQVGIMNVSKRLVILVE